MKSTLFPLLFVLLLFGLLSETTTALSFSYDLTANGFDSVTSEKEETSESCSLDELNQTSCHNETKKVQEIKQVPWSLTKTIQADCQYRCVYDLPSFTAPSTVTIESYTLSTAQSDDYVILFKETNAPSTSDKSHRIFVKIKIQCSNSQCEKECMICPDKSCHQPDYQCPESESYFTIERVDPLNLKKGENTITLLLRNIRSHPIEDIKTEISGTGIATLSSSTIPSLPSGERDSVVVKLDVSGNGEIPAVVKITTKQGAVNFVHTFSVLQENKPTTPLPSEPPVSIINTTKLSELFDQQKTLLRVLEASYQEKKADGYFVTEVYDSIKTAKDYAENVQIALVDEKGQEAQKHLSLFTSAVQDINASLANAKQQQHTFTDKLKDNAILISALVGAIVAVIGLVEKQKSKVTALKEKFTKKSGEKKGDDTKKDESTKK